MLRIYDMEHTYTITQAQSNLPKLIRQANEELQTLSITVRNKTSAYIVPRERMEALVETMEILGNPDAMRAIHKYEAGELKLHPLDSIDEE
jgi:prevent-host-death family protein